MDTIDLLFVIVAALQIADAVTTTMALDRGGFEMNPILRWLFEWIGLNATFLITKGVGLVLLFMYGHMLHIAAWLVLIAVYVWVVHNNVKTVRRLSRRW